MKTKGYYVIWAGRVPGVYKTWTEAKYHVPGFSGARHAGGFVTLQDAVKASQGGYDRYIKDKRDRHNAGPPLF